MSHEFNVATAVLNFSGHCNNSRLIHTTPSHFTSQYSDVSQLHFSAVESRENIISLYVSKFIWKVKFQIKSWAHAIAHLSDEQIETLHHRKFRFFDRKNNYCCCKNTKAAEQSPALIHGMSNLGMLTPTWGLSMRSWSCL